MWTRQRTEADWEQPFPPEEYAARRARVAGFLEARGIDALLVTNPADLYYLTGYDMVWFHLRSLTSCLVTVGADLTFFDYTGHQTLVETTPECRDVRWIQGESPEVAIQTIVEAVSGMSLGGGKIAMQRWGYAPHADVMDSLIRALKESGVSVEDGSLIVQDVRLTKSPREVAYTRAASKIADDAMRAAQRMIRPGVLETEIEAEILYSMLKAGGGDPALRCMIGSGPRAGTHHSPPQQRKVGNDELIFIDFCSSLHRYHVNLNRTFVVGTVDPRWFELMEKAASTIDHIVATIAPGDMWSKVQDAGDAYTDSQGIRGHVWFVGGYALGIAMPPDWVGDYWVRPEYGVEDRPLEPGMVFNFEGQFDDTEGWPGGSGAAYIETLLVTEDGLEVLSTLPRTLQPAGA